MIFNVFFLERLDSVLLFTPPTIWSPPRTGTSRSGWRKSQTSLSTTNYTSSWTPTLVLRRWTPGWRSATTRRSRCSVFPSLSTATLTPFPNPVEIILRLVWQGAVLLKGLWKMKKKKTGKIDKKLPFAVALRGAFPNQLDASFPGTRQQLVLTIVKTFTSSGTSRWDLTILAHAFPGIFQNDI